MNTTRGKIKKWSYWNSEKYISWPDSHIAPIVRVPTPSGRPESLTIRPNAGESQRSLFERCLAYRNKRGVQIWGKKRWEMMLRSKARSVARHRSDSAGPMTGVHLDDYTPGRAPTWYATWYERTPEGKSRKRRKGYSFGTPNARYSTSKEAKARAIEKRKKEERTWYSVLGEGKDRVASKL